MKLDPPATFWCVLLDTTLGYALCTGFSWKYTLIDAESSKANWSLLSATSSQNFVIFGQRVHSRNVLYDVLILFNTWIHEFVCLLVKVTPSFLCKNGVTLTKALLHKISIFNWCLSNIHGQNLPEQCPIGLCIMHDYLQLLKMIPEIDTSNKVIKIFVENLVKVIPLDGYSEL